MIFLGKNNEDDPNSTASFKLVEFSQELGRLALAKMIIMDELAFKYVENEGFSASSSYSIQANTSQCVAEDDDDIDWDDVFSLKMKQKQVDVKKSELERYVGAENEDCKDPSFDILG
ncbi:hypothetical protein KIW84_043040 [Lathyrus oleraceus]|uniref:Uncharacterized protein n=1 Tax=Pisum sativum TaxID=3888 RepID=A0A9D4XE26_PEA|nr:hypothetical protein KIW84_043040 [Pisum sativum]